MCIPCQLGDKEFLETSPVLLGFHHLVEHVINAEIRKRTIVYTDSVEGIVRNEVAGRIGIVYPKEQIRTIRIAKGGPVRQIGVYVRVPVILTVCRTDFLLLSIRQIIRVNVIRARFCKPRLYVLHITAKLIGVICRTRRRCVGCMVEQRTNLKGICTSITSFYKLRLQACCNVQQEDKHIVGRIALRFTRATQTPVTVVHVRKADSFQRREFLHFCVHLLYNACNHSTSLLIVPVGRIAKFCKNQLFRFISCRIRIVRLLIIGVIHNMILAASTTIGSIPLLPRLTVCFGVFIRS